MSAAPQGRTATDLYNDLIQYYAKAMAAGQTKTAQEILAFLQGSQTTAMSQEAKLIVAAVTRGTPFASNPTALIAAAKQGPGQAAIPGAPAAPAGTTNGGGRQSPVAGNVPELGATADSSGNAQALGTKVAEFIANNPPGGKTPTPGGVAKPVGNRGGVDVSGYDQAGLDMALDDDSFLTDLGLRGAGYDTSKAMGVGGQYAESAIGRLSSVLQSLRGFDNGGDGTGNASNAAAVQGLVDQLGSYGTQGGDFYGGIRQSMDERLNNPDFMSMLGDTDDLNKIATTLSNVQGAGLMGSNPMVQEAMKNRLMRTFNEYKRAAAMNPQGVGTLVDFIKNLPPEMRAKILPGMK